MAIVTLTPRKIYRQDLAFGTSTAVENVFGLGATTLNQLALVQTERADLSGTKDGSNPTFTINTAIAASKIILEMVVWNGVVLRPATGYTRSNLVITMAATYLPTGDSAETLECILFYLPA